MRTPCLQKRWNIRRASFSNALHYSYQDSQCGWLRRILPTRVSRRTARFTTTWSRLRRAGPRNRPTSRNSVNDFKVPLHRQAKDSRSMRCYAFFNRWLLPSLLVDCLRILIPFCTQSLLGDLIFWSGLFPSRLRNLAFADSHTVLTGTHSQFEQNW